MRLRERLLALSLVLLFVGWWWLPTWQGLYRQMTGEVLSNEKLDAARISISYVLDRNNWTTFPVSTQSPVIRVVSNATLPSEMSQDTELEWRYGIEFQFLDKKGKVLKEHQHHYRAKVTRYWDERFSETIAGNFFLDPAWQPTDGKVSVLSLADMPDVSAVRVRTLSMDTNIQDVVLRAYQHDLLPESKYGLFWNRLNENQKQAMAKGNIYEHGLLTDQEKRNLIRNKWSGIGPTGIINQEYVSRMLYSFRDIEGDIVDVPVPPAGLYFSADFRGIIPVPLGGARIRLDFEAVGEKEADPGLRNIVVNWHGRGGVNRISHRVDWTSGKVSYTQDYKDGLLEIVASHAGAVRVVVLKGKNEEEITPEPALVRTYLVAGNSIEFDISHLRKSTTPMRLDLRRLLPRDAVVYDIVMDPLDSNKLYAIIKSPSGSRIYKSLNGGARWFVAYADSDRLSQLYKLAIDSREAVSKEVPKEVSLYAGTNNTGVFKSLDEGANWVEANDDIAIANILDLAIDTMLPNTLYAGTEAGGIFKSLDGGESWNAASKGLPDSAVETVVVHPSISRVVYAGTHDGLLKSVDGGANWVAADFGITNKMIFSLTIDKNAPETLYVGTGSIKGGVFKSADGGKSWILVNKGLPDTTVQALAIDPGNSDIIYAGTRLGIFKSTNAGKNWQLASEGLTHLIINDILINPSEPDMLYAATAGGGVFKSRDAASSWFPANNGIETLTAMPSGACEVEYRILDTKGKLIRSKTLVPNSTPSQYDRLTGNWENLNISEPRKYFFSLPSRSAKMQLESECPVVATGYNRPYGMIRKTLVPEYYDMSDIFALQDRQPTWYSLQPTNYSNLIKGNETPLLLIQVRPRKKSEIDDLLAGRYLWQDYQPEAQPGARWLLAKRESVLPARKEALKAFYRPLLPGKRSDLEFVSDAEMLRPSLIYLRQDEKPVHVRIMTDNRLYYEGSISGRRGEVRLPPIRSGDHQFVLKAPGGIDYFINYSAKGRNIAFVKRLAHRFDQGKLSFIYDKENWGNEVFSARLYQPMHTSGRARIRVNITPVGRGHYVPHDGWTFTRRNYDIKAGGGARVPILNTRTKSVDSGQAFFIPFRADLSPGRYRIDLIAEGGPVKGSYLLLAKVNPGVFKQRFIEQEMRGSGDLD